MDIQSIKIDGFKNISKVKLDFEHITALVSLNNFGKSNVIRGIDFGINFIKASSKEKSYMMSNPSYIPINKEMLGRNYFFEIHFLSNINNQIRSIIYGFEFKWKSSNDSQPYIISEFLKIKTNNISQKYKQLIKRVNQEVYYTSSQTGRCNTKLNIGDNELAINKLESFDSLYYLNIVSLINNIKIYIEDNLDAKFFFQPETIIMKELDNEIININNLPRIIYYLKENNQDKYNLLKDVFIQLFPSIEDLFVEKIYLNRFEKENFPDEIPFVFADYVYSLYVKDKNLARTINFTTMSDGAKRVFMILTKIIVSDIGKISLVVIEEPENSIHPALFQSYIRIINQLLNESKIIITSHSPYIINYLEPKWINIGINKTPGIAEFFTLKKLCQKQLEKDASSFSMNMGDYLFSLLADEESNIEDYLELNHK